MKFKASRTATDAIMKILGILLTLALIGAVIQTINLSKPSKIENKLREKDYRGQLTESALKDFLKTGWIAREDAETIANDLAARRKEQQYIWMASGAVLFLGSLICFAAQTIMAALRNLPQTEPHQRDFQH